MKRHRFGTFLWVVLLALCLLPTRRGAAQTAISILTDQIVSDYPEKLTFQIHARSTSAIQKITLIYWTNAHTCQSAIAYQELDFEAGIDVEAEWELDFSVAGIFPPGTLLTWQWEVVDTAESTLLTEEKTYLVIDERYTWQSLNNPPITIQWYRGDASFGHALMDISIRALERLAEEAGITPPEQIWITVYPNAAEVQEVATHSSEWAGGIAYPDYQSIIAGIAPDDLDWAADILPHELAHITTESLVFNCRGVWLPTWLSEGLAVVAEGSLTDRYSSLVWSALESGDLPPLRTITRGFSPYANEAVLSYGHSGMMVAYMLEQFGPALMADLLAAFQAGHPTEEALLSVYQLDTDGLDAAWRISLGFEPQPTRTVLEITPTQIPTLALWTAVIQPSVTPSPSATATPLPTGTATPEPPQPGLTSSPEPSQTTPDTSPGKASILLWIGIPVLIGMLLGALWIIFHRMRRKT